MRQLKFHLKYSMQSCWTTALLFLFCLPVSAESLLTLRDAEHVALLNEPAIQRNQAIAMSLTDSAIADGQLNDPTLTFGLINVPTDDFDLNDNPTTQLRFGIKQMLPKGDTLAFKQLKGEQLAMAKQQQTAWLQKQVILAVRLSFLETFYQQQTMAVLNKNRRHFVELLTTTENFYSVGRASQQDILLAKLELSRLDDRINQALNLLNMSKSTLNKWLPDIYQQSLSEELPVLPTTSNLEQLEQRLTYHPRVLMEDALVNAAKQNVHMAEEQFKPGFNVGIEYRKRFGDEINGQHRDDLMAATVSIELPIFPEKRQNKRLSSSQYNYQAVKLGRLDTLRNMRQQLRLHYGDWLRLSQRAERYEADLLTQAAENSRAALRSYQSGVADFSTLIQSRIIQLETQLQHQRIVVDKTKARAQILFLSSTQTLGATNEHN
ncbi:MAG: TolC family protein [Cycloclasticus sp.]